MSRARHASMGGTDKKKLIEFVDSIQGSMVQVGGNQKAKIKQYAKYFKVHTPWMGTPPCGWKASQTLLLTYGWCYEQENVPLYDESDILFLLQGDAARKVWKTNCFPPLTTRTKSTK